MLSGCAAVGLGEAPAPPRKPSEVRIAPELVPPLGLCRILYAGIPARRQPPPMTCGRAHEIAERHGGRVVKAISNKSFQDGGVLALEYGPGPFGGVPAERLPAPGSCRVWYERTAPERQPPQMACPRAEQLVRENGGRLLYMPASDLK